MGCLETKKKYHEAERVEHFNKKGQLFKIVYKEREYM